MTPGSLRRGPFGILDHGLTESLSLVAMALCLSRMDSGFFVEISFVKVEILCHHRRRDDVVGYYYEDIVFSYFTVLSVTL
jgi:hypothetical protein